MASVIERAEAVSGILKGEFGDCGVQIGNIANFGELYSEHVKSQYCDERDSESDSDDDDDDDEDHHTTLHLAEVSVYNDILKAAGLSSVRGPTGVKECFVWGEDEFCVIVDGKVVPFDDTDAFTKELMPLGTPSGFGDIISQKTRVDDSVRIASEFTDFAVHGSKGQSFSPLDFREVRRVIKGICSSIKDDLSNISVEQYKLNLYGEGGFFTEHVDHPLDAATTLGTLVIVLPTEFTGGTLRVTTPYGGDQLVDGDFGYSRNAMKFKACAFLVTNPHEVRRVKSGCRVTIAYSINWKKHSDALPVIPMNAPEKIAMIKKKLRILRSEYGQVGFILHGRYTPEAVEKLGAACLTHESDIKMHAFLSQQLDVRHMHIINVAYDFESSDDRPLDDFSGDEYGATVHQISLRRWDRLFLKGGLSGDDKDESDFISGRNIPFLYTQYCNGNQTLWDKKDAIRNTGNSAEPGSLRCIYFHTALVIRVPLDKRALEEDKEKQLSSKRSKTDNDSSSSSSSTMAENCDDVEAEDSADIVVLSCTEEDDDDNEDDEIDWTEVE